MTVSQWITKNRSRYLYSEFTVCDTQNRIIVDDRLGYIETARTEEYNRHWKSRCRGRQIDRISYTPKGVVLFIQ